MGLRLALGTTPVQLRSMLVRQGLVTVMAGAAAGFAGAQLTGRLLESLIVGANPIVPAVLATLVVLFALVASAGIGSAKRPISRFDITSL